MFEKLFLAYIGVSLAVSIAIALFLLLRPILAKRFPAHIMCVVWAVFALRILVPFNFTLPKAAVISLPNAQDMVITVNEYETANSPSKPIVGTEIIQEPQEEINAEASKIQAPTQANRPPIMELDFAKVLAGIWLTGAILYAVWQISGRIHFERKIKRWKDSKPNINIIDIAEHTAQQMGIKHLPDISQCAGITSPMLVGVIHPTLLLPPYASYNYKHWQFVMCHELMHYKRHDLAVKVLFVLAKCVHWFNPLVWIMCREGNRSMELACDSAVVKGNDSNFRKAYSNALLDTLGKCPLRAAAFTTYFFDGNNRCLRRRFSNIFDTKQKRVGIISVSLLLCTALLFGCAVAFKPEQAPKETKPVAEHSIEPIEQNMATQGNVAISEITIFSADELINCAESINNGTAKLKQKYVISADIDMKGREWLPINISDIVSRITIDGNGHTIYNLDIDGSGFFANIAAGSSVENLIVAGRVSGSSVGGFANVCQGFIKNCGFIGKVYGQSDYVGGFVGVVSSLGRIERCYTDALVEGASFCGGFAGHIAYDALVKDCYSSGVLRAFSENKITNAKSESISRWNGLDCGYIGGFASSGLPSIDGCIANVKLEVYGNARCLGSFVGCYDNTVGKGNVYNKEINPNWKGGAPIQRKTPDSTEDMPKYAEAKETDADNPIAIGMSNAEIQEHIDALSIIKPQIELVPYDLKSQVKGKA